MKTSSAQKNFTVSDAWCSTQTNDKQFFAMDLGEDFLFTKVATQGKVDDRNRFIKTYELQFSNDNKDWKPYLSEGKSVRHFPVRSLLDMLILFYQESGDRPKVPDNEPCINCAIKSLPNYLVRKNTFGLYMFIHVCMYVCMYVHVCMYGYVCMHVWLCMYVYMYVCMYVCMYLCMYVCMYSYVCMYLCMYVCMYVQLCMHVFTFDIY